MKTCAIFDLDGTLTDSYEAIVSSFEYALKEKGIKPIEDENIRRSYIGPALVQSYEKYYGVSRSEADSLVEIYRRVYREGNMYKVKIYEGIIPMLEKLKEVGYRLFVATSKPKEFAEKILEKIGLMHYFERVEAPGFNDCEMGKEQLIERILNEFSLNPDLCVMVGDTRYDIEGGKKAGVTTIGVEYGYPGKGDFDEADYIAKTPKDICEILVSSVRKVEASVITEKIAMLCCEANYHLNSDIKKALLESVDREKNELCRDILQDIIKNAEIASEKEQAICQDTGMVLVFAEIGQDVHITGGSITEAINLGIKKGYKEGYMRCSVVEDPLRRKNTEDNTPAVIYYDIVPGNNIKITVLPKGFGSENMSDIKMLKPSVGEEGVKEFVIDTVKKAGPNPCPPVVIGIGIGGTMDKAALLSKKALCRRIDSENKDKYYADMEKELLEKINNLNIGPGGFGGTITSLGVNIEAFPTHIAGLPVAVTVSCHVTRHKSIKI